MPSRSGISLIRRRRWLRSSLATFCALSNRTAYAQSNERRFRIAGLTPVSRSAVHWVAFFDELRRQGFIQNHNLEVIGFSIAPDRLEESAVEMARSGVDVIVTGGTGPTRAAQSASRSIPVMTALDDFVGQGFVTSLPSPGGNVSGVSILGPELDGKRQELLLSLVPDARTIAALVDPASTPKAATERLQTTANRRGVELMLFTAGKREEIGPSIENARNSDVKAINVLASQFFNVNRAQIMGDIGNARLPAIYQWPEWCREGGLSAYGPRFETVYRQLARQVAKVLRGTPPASLPVEQPATFELVVNLRTAKAMDFSVPLLFLTNADEVIE